MNKESFEEFESLCNAVFGNVGNGNTQEARERLESICLQPSFVEKAEFVFGKAVYSLEPSFKIPKIYMPFMLQEHL